MFKKEALSVGAGRPGDEVSIKNNMVENGGVDDVKNLQNSKNADLFHG